MANDTLSVALNTIRVAEHKGHREVTLAPASKLVRELLAILQREGYVGEYELIDDGKSGQLRVGLVGKINRCGSVRPRSAVKAWEWEKWEQRFLPSREVGLLVVSTSKGLAPHREAKAQGIGGRLVAFCY